MSLAVTFIKGGLTLLGDQSHDLSRIQALALVITTLDLSVSNMAVATIFLLKYAANSVNKVSGDTLPFFIIVAALILANKYTNDQSYTLRTWCNILSKHHEVATLLAMLNQLETNFLAALDYSLNIKHSADLWRQLGPLDRRHVSQLRCAVEGPEPEATGLATPAHSSPISQALTPVGPVTPLLLAPCMGFTYSPTLPLLPVSNKRRKVLALSFVAPPTVWV